MEVSEYQTSRALGFESSRRRLKHHRRLTFSTSAHGVANSRRKRHKPPTIMEGISKCDDDRTRRLPNVPNLLQDSIIHSNRTLQKLDPRFTCSTSRAFSSFNFVKKMEENRGYVRKLKYKLAYLPLGHFLKKFPVSCLY